MKIVIRDQPPKREDTLEVWLDMGLAENVIVTGKRRDKERVLVEFFSDGTFVCYDTPKDLGLRRTVHNNYK